MTELYKSLLLSGVLVFALGGVLLRPDTFGLGRLPGDVRARFGRATVHFPIVTSLVVSVALSLLLAVLMRAR